MLDKQPVCYYCINEARVTMWPVTRAVLILIFIFIHYRIIESISLGKFQVRKIQRPINYHNLEDTK